MGLFDSEEVRKNKKLIKQSEERRDQLIKSIDQDMSKIRSDMNNIYFEVGKKVLDGFINAEFENYNSEMAADFTEKMKEYKEELKKLAVKKDEIETRYGEELEMLRKLIDRDKNPPDEPEVDVNAEKCSNCRAPREKGAIFCTNCGNKFE